MSEPEYFPNRMRSPGFHVDGHALARFQQLAVADGDHFGLLRLLFGGIGNNDPAAHLFGFFQALHQNPVV